MLELLILYVLNKQDNTLYGLKKEIATHYGEVSIPSHGALFPILKRLEKEKYLIVRKKLSDGGKRYTYYGINNDISELFNKKFMEFNTAASETLENFLSCLKIRLIVIDKLDKNFIGDFKEKSLLKLNFYKEKILNKQNNTYLELNDIQKELLNISLKEIEEYIELINKNF